MKERSLGKVLGEEWSWGKVLGEGPTVSLIGFQLLLLFLALYNCSYLPWYLVLSAAVCFVCLVARIGDLLLESLFIGT